MRARRAATVSLLATLVSAVTFLLGSPADARVEARVRTQAGAEQITSYQSDVTIEPSGDIVVAETIAYDFGAVAHHGIIRNVPVRTDQSGKDGYDRVYPLAVLSVSASDGAPAQYTVEADGDDKQIKIGDPDKTITGEHTYVITYRVRGALNGFADHDELVWNAIGTEWSVPIRNAGATVHAPAPILQVGCATGSFGSNFPCDTAGATGNSAMFSRDLLNPYEGMTFTVALPKGAVPPPHPILEERFNLTSAFRVTPATGGIAGAMLAVLLGIVVFLVWKFGRDRRYAGSAVDAAYGKDGGPEVSAPLHEAETPVEFVPPDDLRPGQLGTLIDFVANPLDVTATIIDLAVRGYLKIEEVEKAWYQRKHDWKLIKVDKEGQLLQYERTLYEGLFRTGDEILLSDLHNTFAARMQSVQKELMNDAMSKGWFSRRPGTVKGWFVALGVVVLALGVGLTVLLAATTHAGLIGIPLAVGGVLMIVGARWMPRRTAKGYAVLRHAEGFKRFIDESEKRRAEEVGARFRRPRRRGAGHVVVVRLAARARLRPLLRRHRWFLGDDRGHVDVVAVVIGLERLQRRRVLGRRRGRRGRRLLVTRNPNFA
jgi:hypothetical protein